MFYRDITAMVFCSQQDCLIIATEDLSIRIWGPDWELRVAFVGHHGKVPMFFCTLFVLLYDCTSFCDLSTHDITDQILLKITFTLINNESQVELSIRI